MATEEELSHCFTVSDQEAHMRLDQLLTTRFPAYSRTYFQFLLEQGGVLVNGKVLKKRSKTQGGDSVEICFILTPEIQVEPQDIPLEILYEDEHLLVANKPMGMVVHPAPGHREGTFANALLFHCHTLPHRETLRPGIVHRLDKDTTGLLLAAKTLEAHSKLIALFAERQIEKTYLAICVNTPPEGLIETKLQRNPLRRQEMRVHPTEGKEAKSRCKVLAHNEQLSLVEVALLTGRTHQIRVHLKSVGAPVLGDPVYGSLSANQRFGAQRQLLHAYRLKWIHPLTQQELVVEAPLPTDMQAVMESQQWAFTRL